MGRVSDLMRFLAARLDELERTARDSGPACVAWLIIDVPDARYGTQNPPFYTTVAASDDLGEWVADGKVLAGPSSVSVIYDPARVLREVAAKRKILGCIEMALRNDPLTRTYILTALASVDSDHPDYDQAWATA